MDFEVLSADELVKWGASVVGQFRPGDVVLLHGQLGAGKTTLVRGMLQGLGYDGVVRSPSYNLLQTFATSPPVVHADFYRVPSTFGTGIEDYLEDHVCFVEWPEKVPDLEGTHQIWIEFLPSGRRVKTSFEVEA